MPSSVGPLGTKLRPSTLTTSNPTSGIGDADTRHETVNHSAEEWAVGDVHTNSIEGVWSLFKRSIVGSFHKMSVKHMDRYLGRAGVALQQPRQPPHLPRHAGSHREHRPAHLPRSGGLGWPAGGD